MKTRIYWGLIALAAFVITGCAKNEVVSSLDNAIEFGTYLGRDAQTKGSVFTTASMQAENVGFGVFAYYTDEAKYSDAATPNFMYNQQVTYGTEGWTYAPVKYWPNEKNDYISFFAYAPYGDYSLNTANPVINFTVAEDVTDQIDLVAADAVKDAQKQNVNDKVKFTFNHVLSRVGFKVEAVMNQVNNQDNAAKDETPAKYPIEDGTVISVQEVEIYGNFNTKGDLNLNGAIWGNQTAAATSYKLAYDDFVKTVADNVTISPALLNKDTEYMMLIPTGTIAVKVRVKYTVTTTDPKLAGGKSEVVNDITSAEFPFTFAQGKAYNFVLHLGLTSIKLDAEVTDWDESTDHVVNVPNNTTNN